VAVLVLVSISYMVMACTPIYQAEQTRAFAWWLLALGTPWAFLLRPTSAGAEAKTQAPESVRVRETLIALAVTHMAMAFPVAGTQLSCGASFFVLAALASAHDGLTQELGKIVATRVTLALVLVAATVPACAASATYGALTSLGLPGASWLRVNSKLATQFRVATATLRTNGGPFVTVYGMNSLYLWTQMAPPTVAAAPAWDWLNDAEQSAIVAVLERDERSAVLVVSGSSGDAKNQILGRWIRDRTTPVMEVGPLRWQFRRRVRDQVPP
jgi:hypothetical protein